jgi:hypothetical protein
MSAKSNVLLMFFSLTTVTNSELLGDFSPLKVGNHWIYFERLVTSSRYITEVSENVLKLSVTEKSISLDTIIYTISQTDSSVKKISVNEMPPYDTVFFSNTVALSTYKTKELKDSILIDSSKLINFFKFHYYPDSSVYLLTYNLKTITSVKLANYTSGLDSIFYFKDVGLGRYSHQGGNTGLATLNTVDLVSFNDMDYGSVPIQNIYRNKQLKNHQQKRTDPIHFSFGRIRSNLLGRLLRF